MKKIILIIMMLFSFAFNVYAKEELIINDIKISNGEITPKFDKYNNYYSVTIDKSTSSLSIECNYNEEKFDIEISNNENLVNNKLVYITVFDRDTLEQNTYIFKIYVDDIEDKVVNIEDDSKDLKVDSKKKSYNYAPLVGTICFVLIIFVYYIMFLR